MFEILFDLYLKMLLKFEKTKRVKERGREGERKRERDVRMSNEVSKKGRRNKISIIRKASSFFRKSRE